MAALEQSNLGQNSRNSDTHDANTLIPPQLPPFLAGAFDLRPIIGAPTDEEMKSIHGAMKALNGILHAPELRDTSLPIELSQHLFDAQLARYREKYTVGIFPNDIVYTPPSLPVHIPFKLDPIVGPPSNDQLKLVHATLRASDNFTNVASLFDPDLHMEISQHLFDLQLARHIQRPQMVQPTGTRPSSASRTTSENVGDSATKGNPPARDNQSEQEISVNNSMPLVEPSSTQPPTAAHSSGLSSFQGQEIKHNPQETNKLLVEIADQVKKVGRILVASQNSLAKGLNCATPNSNGFISFNLGAHHLINENGEDPSLHGLPTFKISNGTRGSFSIGSGDQDKIAQYLRFYGIGSDMIEQGDTLEIKSGMLPAARDLLKKYIYLVS